METLKITAILALCIVFASFAKAQSQQSGDVVITGKVSFDSLPDTIKSVVSAIYKTDNPDYVPGKLQVFTGELVMCLVGHKTHACNQHVGLIYLIGVPENNGWEGINKLTTYISLNNRFKIANDLPGYVKSKHRLNDSTYIYGVVDFQGRTITGGEGVNYPMPKNQHYNVTVPEIVAVKPIKKKRFWRC